MMLLQHTCCEAYHSSDAEFRRLLRTAITCRIFNRAGLPALQCQCNNKALSRRVGSGPWGWCILLLQLCPVVTCWWRSHMQGQGTQLLAHQPTQVRHDTQQLLALPGALCCSAHGSESLAHGAVEGNSCSWQGSGSVLVRHHIRLVASAHT
jgi:hypothetical protein